MLTTIEELEDFDLKNDLEKAVLSDERWQFFSQSFDVTEDKGDIPYYSKYTDQVTKLLNNVGAVDNYFSNLQLPVYTARLCDKIKDEVSKVFNAEDRYNESNAHEDFKEKYGLDYFASTFFDKFHYSPNDVIAVVPTDSGNEIVYYPISNIKHIKIDDDGNITECAIFLESDENGNDKYINFDKNGIYSLIAKNDSLVIDSEGVNYTHNKDYCTCNFISSLRMNSKNPVNRVNYLSSRVSDLDRILFVKTVINILDTFGYVFRAEYGSVGCDYTNGTDTCSRGYLQVVDSENNPFNKRDSTGALIPCPVCNNSKVVVGGKITIERNGESDVSLSEALAFIAPDVSLYVNREDTLKNRETSLFNDVCNRFDEINNNQQHNKDRVEVSVDSRKHMYVTLGHTLAKIVRFTLKSACYLSNTDPEINVTLGQDYFLNSEDEYLNLISKAKDAGVLDIVDYKKGLVYNKFPNNEKEKQKGVAMIKLESLFKLNSSLSSDQIVSLYESGKVSLQDFYSSTNFTKIVNSFENTLESKHLGIYYIGLIENESEYELIEEFEKFYNSEISKITEINIITKTD